jgi:hypothetical protein
MATGNEKVSNLTELTAAEIQSNDLFCIVDTSAKESKKMQSYQLSLYLSASGSLYALHAITSDTASYALSVAGSSINDFGVFSAQTQSLSHSLLNNVIINPTTIGNKATNVNAVGTVNVIYTSSVAVDETIYLRVKNTITSTETDLDSTPVYFNMSPVASAWDTLGSGSFKTPFSLMGQVSISGSYQVFITASSGVTINIEPTRTCKFNISSLSDIVTVGA